MTPNKDEIASAVGQAAATELADALAKIKHCLNQLSDKEVWWRPQPSLNSIGNMILHLRGNLRQWIVCGVGGAVDIRDRPKEFTERGPISKAELLRQLNEVVHEAQAALLVLSADEILEHRRIQATDQTAISAIFDSVSHFRGHTQEIVLMTRMQLGEAYGFFGCPSQRSKGRWNRNNLIRDASGRSDRRNSRAPASSRML
jgi:uncharacterized protein DUF1572